MGHVNQDINPLIPEKTASKIAAQATKGGKAAAKKPARKKPSAKKPLPKKTAAKKAAAKAPRKARSRARGR